MPEQTLTGLFTDIADAIRAKKGTEDEIVATDFPSEIESIPSGSSLLDNTITFKVDGDDYAISSIKSGETIPEPKVPTKSGYGFLGWGTSASASTYITFPYTPTSANETLHANFIQGGHSFATDSWEVIAQCIKNGNDNYSLGDTKTDLITIGGASYSAVFKIVDNKVGRYKTQSGVSHKVIELQTIFGDTATTGLSGGWNSNATSFNNSNLKSWLNSTGLSCLPSSLQSVLETTTVYSGNGSSNASATNIVAATGKIFSPSEYEYYNSDYGFATIYETRNPVDSIDYGQYQWYKKQGTSSSSYSALIKKMANNTASYYWTRSPYGSSNAVYVDFSGSRNYSIYGSTGSLACVCFAW